MRTSTRLRTAVAAALLLPVAACAGADRAAAPDPAAGRVSTSPATTPSTSPPATSPTPAPTSPSTPPPTPEATAPTTPAGPQASDGQPRRAALSIPELGIRDLAVVPYRGWTDDAPGTEIQDRGLAASPFGPRGGVGPGGVGNYQVTAHRLSSTQAFLDLPDLRAGDRVHVDAGGVRYTYEVRDTRITSFRSARSLREQRAAVPGRPGVEPTRAMITLSTCRTPEDRAEGNYWSDQFGNPENRIDKIGVLVRTTPAR